MEKYSRACRHMYAMLQRHPTISDAKIRLQNGYTHEYGVNDASSVKSLKLRDKFAHPGVPLSVEDVAREGGQPLDFFKETLGKSSASGHEGQSLDQGARDTS